MITKASTDDTGCTMERTDWLSILPTPSGAPAEPLIIAAVGAGGKTMTLHDLMDLYALAGWRSVLTTTARIYTEPGMATDTENLLVQLERTSRCVFAHPIDNQFAGNLSEEDWVFLRTYTEMLLIEGDDALDKPLKMPTADEPNIPPDADRLLIVCGMSAIGKPLQDVCFNFEGALEVIRAKMGAKYTGASLVTPAMAAQLIIAGYLDNSRVTAVFGDRMKESVLVIFNQADYKERVRDAQTIRRLLPRGMQTVITSNQHLYTGGQGHYKA